MQTKIVFVGGSITAQTFAHENMHQWWGDAVSYAQPKYTFFKEGYADMSEYLHIANIAGLAAGPAGSDAYKAAFEASIVSRFNGTGKYNTTQHLVLGRRAGQPDLGQPVLQREHVHPPGHVLHRAARDPRPGQLPQGQHGDPDDYRYGSIVPADEIAIFHKYMPNQSIGCSNKLDAFFKQWWDTSYTGSPAAGNRPQITGPGLAGGGFYDANGGCSDYGVDVPATPAAPCRRRCR